MPIPELIQFEEWKVLINQKFIDFNEFVNWSPERQIEVLYKLAKDCIYWNSNFSDEKIEKSMQWFNWAYWLAKLKFQDIRRNTWWRYFDHLINVMQYVVTNSKNPTIKKAIIAICHDLIEDTDISFVTLKEIFWSHIALGVLLISKNPIRNYISKRWVSNLTDDEKEIILKSWIISSNWIFFSRKFLEKKYNKNENLTKEELNAEEIFLKSLNDFELFEIIENSWILNFKWIISDEFYQKETYELEKINVLEKWAKETYISLEKKYKDIRNADYFSHILSDNIDPKNIEQFYINVNTPCLNKFYNYAIKISSSPNLKIDLNIDEIKQVCLDAIEVKFWDRIDNIKTTEVYSTISKNNIEKASRKLEETKKYFYQISKEFDSIMWTNFYWIISNEIEKLEEFIKNLEKDKDFNIVCLSIKSWVEWTIKKP